MVTFDPRLVIQLILPAFEAANFGRAMDSLQDSLQVSTYHTKATSWFASTVRAYICCGATIGYLVER